MTLPAECQLKMPRTLRLAAAVAVALLLIATGAAAYWPSESRHPRAATSATSDLVATPDPGLAIGEAFTRTWQRTDAPVLDGEATRTWMWGPAALEDDRWEDYAESPGSSRAVRYYDKSRMEVSDPAGDQGSPWYVTNGLLVVELISGRMQTGEHRFEQRDPARLNIAGDAGPGNGPTYASMAALLTAPAREDGELIIQRLDSDGVVTVDPALEAQAVTAAQRVSVPGIDHQIASPFWTFMQSSGPIRQGDTIVQGPLFENPYYATGLPITEAYWATVDVGNVPRDVLLQCFERRCLTWTPDNPEDWRVESGNVGLHYREWRHGGDPEPTPAPTIDPSVTPAALTPTETPAPATTATAIGPGAVDAWMRSVVRDAQDRLWLVAMNNSAATAGTGPGELRVYRATAPGLNRRQPLTTPIWPATAAWRDREGSASRSASMGSRGSPIP
ncbi:MAG: peptidase domain-containing protein [Thermomicrobiales bacterium]